MKHKPRVLCWAQILRARRESRVKLVRYVCVFLPIHSGHQVRWTYQPGSHRSNKVTQDFSSIFLLRCVPYFFSREGFSHSFPSSTVNRILCTNDLIVLHSLGIFRYIFYNLLRPFLTRKFFQEILGLEGSKISWEKKRFFTRKFSGKISSGNFGSNSPSRRNFEAQTFLETTGNFTRKFLDHLIIELKSVPFPSIG